MSKLGQPKTKSALPRHLSVIFALLALAVLSPYLTTGYFVDDATNSLLPAYLKIRKLSLAQFIVQENRSWMFSNGRFFPLALAFSYPIWFWIRNLLIYRWIQVALVVSNLFLFQALIQALGGGKRLAALAALLALSFFQLRNYHDPIASYCYLMQLEWAGGAGSILIFARFLKTGRTLSLAFSLFLYLGTLLLYETGLTFFPILFFLAMQPLPLGSTGRRRLARFGALGITGFYLSSVAYLRFAYPLAYNGTRSHLGGRAIITFFRQLSGAWPLVYAFFGKSGFYTFSTLGSREFLTLPALVIFGGGSWVFFKTLQFKNDEKPPAKSLPAALQIFIFTLLGTPTLLIALSEKYQEGIDRPGMAYLPVYLSYFGAALWVAQALVRRPRGKIAATALGALLAFAYSTNQIAADHLNRYWRYPREMVERAFRRGLLSEVEPAARILRAGSDSWDWATPEFLLWAADLPNPVGNLAEAMKNEPSAPTQKTYVVIDRVQAPGEGQILLAPLDHVAWDPKHVRVDRIFTAGPVRVFDFNSGTARTRTFPMPEISLGPKDHLPDFLEEAPR